MASMPGRKLPVHVAPAAALLLLVALTLPAACAPSHHAGPAASLTRKPMPVLRAEVIARRIHELINRERAAKGLSPLAFDSRLAAVARGHSRDMAKRNYFDHNSPEGHDFSQRYRRAGYDCAIRAGGMVHLGAENIALNHRYAATATINGVKYYDWNSEDKIAATTVEGWMNSPGHRKNILTPHWQREGIGIEIAPNDGVYITQNFC